MLSPSVKSELFGCDFTTAIPWLNGVRDLSMARAAAEWRDPHRGLKWPPGKTGPAVCLWKTDPGLGSWSGDYTERSAAPAPSPCQQQQQRLPVKPAHRQQSMDGPAASSQPARGVLFLFNSLGSCSSPMLGEIRRCRRKATGDFWELWHRPHWQQRPTTRGYLLPSSTPWHFPASLSS